ncbi:MAG TPA: M56 family metallopeptidase [Steroidobacteraceae bacterium]|nr:M56 family metallopeptidase [Steroidobacteraceae bacterium]
MHEHVAPAIYYLEVHLLFASLVCLAAWVLTSLWQGAAAAKYWIWVATSLNFLVPFGGFFNGFGAAHLSWATQLGGLADIGIGISRNLTAAALLLGVWLCGAVLMLARLLARVQRDRRDQNVPAARSVAPLGQHLLAHGVPVRLSAAGQGPSVDGVLRPHISLPAGIDQVLTEAELEAVLIHEVTHARRRDNLVGLLHELALCALWFHPLVWLTSSRLALFRELSCDDSVIERSRGADLISALAKLADPGESRLLSAGAATLFRHRLARLETPQPPRARGAADLALVLAYAIVLLACMLETVAHTPSCFKVPI